MLYRVLSALLLVFVAAARGDSSRNSRDLLVDMKRPTVRFFAFWACLYFVVSLLGCAGPEIIPTASHLPTSAQVEAEKEALAIPAELRTRLNAVVAESCKVAENNRPDPRYLAQSAHGDSGLQLKLLVAVAEWLIEKETGSKQPVVA